VYVADALKIPYRSQECAKGGMALARFVGEAYTRLSDEGVVAVGGSVGRGDADRYSDVEIFVFWPTLPAPEIRRELIDSLGGTLWTMDRDGETMEHFGVGELQVGNTVVDGISMVSVRHLLFANVEAAIDRVFVYCATDPEDHAFLAVIRDAVPLEDSNLWASWQSRIADYPGELVRAVVRENIDFGPWFVPQAFIAREDRLVLHAHMHTIERKLLKILAALNRSLVAFPSGKWARRGDALLSISPDNLRGRLEACYGPDLAAGWSTMRELMMETLDLVESRLGSGFTTDTGASICDNVRKRWLPLPPYTLMLAAQRAIEGGISESS